VLDIDGAGADTFAEWLKREGGEALGMTLSAQTGSGGLHLYFAAPADGVMPRNVSKKQRREGRVPPGIDVRGTGGQAVLPPSVSGKGAYAWLNWGAPVLQAPAWLLSLVREESSEREVGVSGAPVRSEQAASLGSSAALGELTGHAGQPDVTGRGPAYARAAVQRELAELHAAPVGTRNDTAFAVACRLIELCNAPWSALDADAVKTAWYDAGFAHPEGMSVSAGELIAVWQSAERKVGDGEAELPESWMDGEVIPFSSAPWASSSGSTGNGVAQGAAAGTGSVAFLDPGVNPTESVGIAPAAPDPVEQAVHVEMQRQWIRDEAKRRLSSTVGGTLAERLAAMRGKLLSNAALLALTSPVMLVPDVFQLDSLARVVGGSGHGKSFVTLALAGAVGTGGQWAGRQAERGDVLYIVGESLRGYVDRVAAWQAYHKTDMTGVRFFPEPVQVNDPSQWEPLVLLAGELAPKLIVLDTQARMSVGVNENDPSDMGLFVDACERLRAATGACVLLVHHTPVGAERGRGTGAVLGAMNTEVLCRKEGSSISLKLLKQKDGREDIDDLNFELRAVHGSTAGADGFIDPDGAIGVTPVWVGRDGAGRGDAPFATAPEELSRKAGLAARLAAEVFARGRGGTKAEFKSVLVPARMSRTTFYEVWAELLEHRVIGQVRGTQSFRHIPVDERGGLIEPVGDGDGKGGFYAP
jgi:hypothetical protein